MASESIERERPLASRDRALLLGEIGAVTLIAWLYLMRMPMAPSDLGELAARVAAPLPPGLIDLGFNFAMWSVMMVAMMLPSAAPAVMTYARIAKGRSPSAILHSWAFAAGYVLVWTGFSIAATLGQAALQRALLLSSALRTSPLLGGMILVAAGIYQLTPLKNVCLAHCRSPLSFFMTSWREGAGGALRMGIEHGVFCLGCCSMLMALLFVAGVMNLLWVAAISVFVLLEKATRQGAIIARIAGAALIVSGLVLSLRGWTA